MFFTFNIGEIMERDTKQTAVTAKIKKLRGGFLKTPVFYKNHYSGGVPHPRGGFPKGSFFEKLIF